MKYCWSRYRNYHADHSYLYVFLFSIYHCFLVFMGCYFVFIFWILCLCAEFLMDNRQKWACSYFWRSFCIVTCSFQINKINDKQSTINNDNGFVHLDFQWCTPKASLMNATNEPVEKTLCVLFIRNTWLQLMQFTSTVGQ